MCGRSLHSRSCHELSNDQFCFQNACEHGKDNLQLTGTLNSTLPPLAGSALGSRLGVETIVGLSSVSVISKSPVFAADLSVRVYGQIVLVAHGSDECQSYP
jgi:hypothetical protein